MSARGRTPAHSQNRHVLPAGAHNYVDEEGCFFFVDRKKDMIKRAGENVAASEVEDVLEQHSAVFDAAVVGVPDPVRDQSVKAYVIVREQATATAGELIAWCRARLSPFKVTMGDDGPGLCPLCLEGARERSPGPLARPVEPHVSTRVPRDEREQSAQ